MRAHSAYHMPLLVIPGPREPKRIKPYLARTLQAFQEFGPEGELLSQRCTCQECMTGFARLMAAVTAAGLPVCPKCPATTCLAVHLRVVTDCNPAITDACQLLLQTFKPGRWTVLAPGTKLRMSRAWHDRP